MEDDRNCMPVENWSVGWKNTSLPAFCSVIWDDSGSHMYSEASKCGAFQEWRVLEEEEVAQGYDKPSFTFLLPVAAQNVGKEQEVLV